MEPSQQPDTFYRNIVVLPSAEPIPAHPIKETELRESLANSEVQRYIRTRCAQLIEQIIELNFTPDQAHIAALNHAFYKGALHQLELLAAYPTSKPE